MAQEYLDDTGLAYFWGKIKAYVSNAVASYTETDPTVPSWAKQSTKPTYTASEVGATQVQIVRW